MNYIKSYFIDIPIIQHKDLNLEGVLYGFTTKEVKKEEVIKKFELNGFKLITASQIHSNRVMVIKNRNHRRIVGDALLTEEVGLFIGVKTADCLPILIVDRTNRAVGAIHAGWRGTLKKIVLESLKKFTRKFHSDPSELIAILGPSISKCCYEIGSDIESLLRLSFPDSLEHRESKIYFDLRHANENILLKSGFKKENIFDIPLCTKCHEELFYSYRRGENNRNIAFIGILREVQNERKTSCDLF